jgi:hypothetical protein
MEKRAIKGAKNVKGMAGKAGKKLLGKLSASLLGGPIGMTVGACGLVMDAIALYDASSQAKWNQAQRINAMSKQEFKKYMADMQARSKAHQANKAAAAQGQRGGVGKAGSSKTTAKPTGGGRSGTDGSQHADDMNVADDIEPKAGGGGAGGHGGPSSVKPKGNASNQGSGDRQKSHPKHKCRNCGQPAPYYTKEGNCMTCDHHIRTLQQDPTARDPGEPALPTKPSTFKGDPTAGEVPM